MKRWPFRISPRRAAFGGTICLILGVVTTVGVAWLAVAVDVAITTREFEPEIARARLNAEFGEEIDWPDKWLDGWVATRVSVGATLHGIFLASAKQVFARYDVSNGLPFRALHGSVRVARGTTVLTGAFNPPGSQTEPWTIIPLRPILPGFLINTLFYAAIWFGLFFAIGRTRRFIRTRRGRCPRCGYDLRGEFDDGCSECGWNRAGEGTEASRQQGIDDGAKDGAL